MGIGSSSEQKCFIWNMYTFCYSVAILEYYITVRRKERFPFLRKPCSMLVGVCSWHWISTSDRGFNQFSMFLVTLWLSGAGSVILRQIFFFYPLEMPNYKPCPSNLFFSFEVIDNIFFGLKLCTDLLELFFLLSNILN